MTLPLQYRLVSSGDPFFFLLSSFCSAIVIGQLAGSSVLQMDEVALGFAYIAQCEGSFLWLFVMGSTLGVVLINSLNVNVVEVVYSERSHYNGGCSRHRDYRT
ncbi:hypothetical protein C8Q78DRAFT_788513 [Trametes maxima]|nr:hypothetical protein C8Q78DRAFT_788513 [Trametes maxima]